jgi:hypothetical protein
MLLQVVNHLKQQFFKQLSIGPGTISVHVRRGDKVRIGEMRRVDDSTYQNYARALYVANTDVLNQTVFASTEDPTALSSMVHGLANWTVQYTSVPRNNHAGRSVSCSVHEEYCCQKSSASQLSPTQGVLMLD